MKILIRNNISQLVIGGRDHLVDPSLLSNLRSYLSIPVPGAWHSEQFQKHAWDGKKYFLTPKGKMPTGMLPVLLGMLEEDYPDLGVELIDERPNMVRFNKEWDTKVGDYAMEGDYIHQLELAQAFNHTIKFRDQEIYFPRGIVDAATNAGKTTIIAGLRKNIIGDQSMLILIHRKAIYQQLVQFMGEVFGDVGQINDKYYEIKPVTVAMVQTLANRVGDGVRAKQDIASFNTLVVDEAHRAGAKQYKTVLKHSEAYCRVFLSGTAFDSSDDISKLTTISLSGMKLKEVKKAELMEKGISTPVEVHMHFCNTLLYQPILDYRSWIKECIYFSSERAAIIHKLIEHASGPMLVGVDKIEHGKYIYERVMEMGTSKRVAFTNGQDKEQLQKIQQLKDGDIDVLISTAILSEGVNLPTVKELIYAAGGKAAISVKQWSGRIERKHHTKTKAIFHDFYDTGNHCRQYSEKRIKIYEHEDLPIVYHYDREQVKTIKSIIIQ